jgi:hypothetical protein
VQLQVGVAVEMLLGMVLNVVVLYASGECITSQHFSHGTMSTGTAAVAHRCHSCAGGCCVYVSMSTGDNHSRVPLRP